MCACPRVHASVVSRLVLRVPACRGPLVRLSGACARGPPLAQEGVGVASAWVWPFGAGPPGGGAGLVRAVTRPAAASERAREASELPSPVRRARCSPGRRSAWP